ncbi:hypothetical protein [Gordonia amicalis]|uniref:Rv3651-like N-terminal domain-containing protein n=1 Tax=Gordonia amicalis TaxID=89053 RepID=A0ABU4DJP3_9ACTN|nr:hypothetical protein [Gordonia amicalis]MDV6309981.1 hypothetical protein [Gordonia amicalis]
MIGTVATKTSDPMRIAAVDRASGSYGQQLHRALGSPRQPLLDGAQRAVRRAIAIGEVVESSPVLVRDVKFHSVADPVLNGQGGVSGVWLWTGPADEPRPTHPVAGGWSWNLSTRPILATYGPGIGAIYDRPDLLPGLEYDVNEITGCMDMDIAALVAPKIASPVDGTRIALRPRIDSDSAPRPLRAVTEVVRTGDAGREWEWRGLTWDVTETDPLTESPMRAAAHLAAGLDNAWTAIAYWRPALQLLDVAGARPQEIFIDPQTHKAVLAPVSVSAVRRLRADLERSAVATATLSFRTTSGGFASYQVTAANLRGSPVPAATITLRRAVTEC